MKTVVMSMMAWFALFGVGMLAVNATSAQHDASVMAPAGTYTVQGGNPDGKSYKGILTIKAVEGAIYFLEWELPGGDSAQGYAIHDGDVLSMICVSGDAVCYGHLKWRDGAWRGKWSLPQVPVIGTEIWTPTKTPIEQLRKELNAVSAAI